MRQVNVLARVLARVMSLDQAQRPTTGGDWLSQAVSEVTGMDLLRLRRASRSQLLSACERGGQLSPDLAVAVADILMEDARIQDSVGLDELAELSRERATWLYEMARDAGGTLPLGVHERLRQP